MSRTRLTRRSSGREASRSEFEVPLAAPEVGEPIASEAHNDCGDAQRKGWSDAPIELGTPPGWVTFQKDAVGCERKEDARDHVDNVVLLRKACRTLGRSYLRMKRPATVFQESFVFLPVKIIVNRVPSTLSHFGVKFQ